MRNFLYNFAKRIISLVLTQEPWNNINTSLYKFKTRHKWIFQLIYGTASDEEIFNNILQRLDGKIEIIMIHSSLNGMIPMYNGNPSKLLSLIISYCKQNNITLAMPTFFGGSNLQAKEHYESGKHVFDVSNTISEMGMLTEIFRRIPGVVRSIHPTHSICALGPLADELTRNHHLADTTFGEGTPFCEMIKYNTIILGLGVKSYSAGTQIHSAEDILKDKYPIALHSDIIPVTCFDQSGNTLIYNLRIRKKDYIYDWKTIRKELKKIGKEWTYKSIPFYLTQANIVTETFIEAAKKGQTIYKLN